MRANRWLRAVALIFVMALVTAACGEDETDTTAGAPGDGEVSLDEEVEVAPGTTLRLPDCPSDWDAQTGLTDTEINLFMSLPESGPVAALGGLDDGMRAYFKQMEPIAGRSINLRSADDAYDPSRTLSNTQEALDTNEPFAFVYMIGTPNNLAIRNLLNDECAPQLFNSTGFPGWGDPNNFPWTIGGLLSYNTEARLWCNYIADEIGENTKVAGLFMDNDFGKSYRQEMEACDSEGVIDLVEVANHDPAAPDVTGQITTLTASDAQVIVLGTTGAACSQSMAALARSNLTKILSYTCQSIPAYFKPVDPAGEGVLVAVSGKDATMQDDPAVQEAIQILRDAGLDPFQGSFFTGVIFAHTVEKIFRQAAEMEGGLNRVNLMRAVWNADVVNPLGLDGSTYKTNGVNDAYLVESARFARYVPPGAGDQLGRYEFIGDLIDLEGRTGSVGQQPEPVEG